MVWMGADAEMETFLAGDFDEVPGYRALVSMEIISI